MRIFARSVLPQVEDVQPNDRFQSGVALKASEEEICVYPYVFREVCRNGAIMAHSQQALRVDIGGTESPQEAAATIREAIGECCRDDVFPNSLREIRTTIAADVDLALTLLPYASRQSGGQSILVQILERFASDGDSSRYGLMNAVTSVARDTTDPEERWQLEELGGGIAAGNIPRSPVDSAGVQLDRVDAVTLG